MSEGVRTDLVTGLQNTTRHSLQGSLVWPFPLRAEGDLPIKQVQRVMCTPRSISPVPRSLHSAWHNLHHLHVHSVMICSVFGFQDKQLFLNSVTVLVIVLLHTFFSLQCAPPMTVKPAFSGFASMLRAGQFLSVTTFKHSVITSGRCWTAKAVKANTIQRCLKLKSPVVRKILQKRQSPTEHPFSWNSANFPLNSLNVTHNYTTFSISDHNWCWTNILKQ